MTSPVQVERLDPMTPTTTAAVAAMYRLGARLVRIDRDTVDSLLLVARLGGEFIEIYSDGSYGPWRGGAR